MPVDLSKKQTIEEITNGRIKKKPAVEAAPPARPARARAVRPEAARKAGRRRR